MSEALIALLESMRASRAALAAQLDEAAARNQSSGKSNGHAAAQRLGLAAAAVAALTAAWRWRRRR